MQDSKKGFTPFRYGINLSQDQCPMTIEEKEYMKTVPYASTVGSLIYVMLCTRPDICYLVGIMSRYQSIPGREHWTAVKHILKYLRRMRDYMLVYHGDELALIVYSGSDFQSDEDLRNPPLDMFLHWMKQLLVGGVSSNHVLMIKLWKLNMWQLQRQLRKQYGLGNSLWN